MIISAFLYKFLVTLGCVAFAGWYIIAEVKKEQFQSIKFLVFCVSLPLASIGCFDVYNEATKKQKKRQQSFLCEQLQCE